MNQSKKENPSKPRYNMWQCAGYMIALAWREREKKVLVLSLLQALLAVGTSLIGLYIPPTILSVVERRAPVAELMMAVGIFTLLMMLCKAASSYVGANVLYGKVTVRSALIGQVNKKCCTTAYPNMIEEPFIKLRARCNKCLQNNNESAEAIWKTMTLLVQNLFGFAAYLTLILFLNPWLMLGILVLALAGYFANKRFSQYAYLHREEEGEIEGRLEYQAMPAKNYELAKDIRIFDMKPWINEVTEKTMAAYTAFHGRANTVYLWGSIIDLILAFLRNGIAYWYLIGLTLGQGLSVAQFLLYFSAVGGFTAWVSGILDSLTKLYRQGLDISILREFLEYPEPFLLEDGADLPTEAGQQHTLSLENVYYRYPGAQEDTLEDINLTIRPGEKIAIVGLNGAGKTTLVKLICGLLDPTSGRVLLDGTDVRTYNRRAYYALFSAVFQDFSLLAGTLATNVAQRENADMSRVLQCIEEAGLTETVDRLEEGVGAYLNRTVHENGAELSGGEVQKLMLARALYKDAPFIVLDEPTAALDPIAEADLYVKYNRLTHNRSAVYISHRLASTRFCDRILLIGNRGIAEEGTHIQLLKQGGDYARLFAVQSKYYQKEGDPHGTEQRAVDLA